MPRHRHEGRAFSSTLITTRSLSSPALPISSALLNASERVLAVRPLTLLLDYAVAPAIERLALVEDAFVSLPFVRLIEGYGISSCWASILTIALASLQLRRALRRQRDLTLLMLSTAWPIWRTVSTPASSLKPRRVEAFWVLFALLQGFEATRVQPHPVVATEDPLTPSLTLSERLRPALRLVVRVQREIEKRVLKVAQTPLPPSIARPTAFPEPSPYYFPASSPTSVARLPRLALSLRTFGTSWPLLKLLFLWALTFDDFALANRLLAPFRSPRPRPPGRRVVTVVTVQDPAPSAAGTAPPSPPRTPDLERDNGSFVTSSVHGGGGVVDLGEGHGVWAKGYHLGDLAE